MAGLNKKRVWLGTLVGGIVWSAWSSFINMVILMPRYMAEQTAHNILNPPRYPFFVGYWFILLFVLTYILIWIYVQVRLTLGPGPMTAFRIGFLFGFAAAFPLSLVVATWATFSRVIPLGWMCDLWVGAILATIAGAWLYKEA
ncbi:MAG: hypothetical protein ACM3NO_05330 [Deltaproteobacteria bacterium]